MRNKILLFFILVNIAVRVGAQDPKFSQYFASPQSVNPAFIGYFDGNYRLSLNTRKQWANLGAPYNTSSISGDLKLNDEYNDHHIFSVGVSGLFEESFNKALKSNVVNLGFSYYKFFDADHRIKLGLSPQLTYVNKSLDFSALTFASQFNNGTFNTNLPNYLDVNNNSLSYFDFNVGANFAVALETVKFAFGYSVYHLLKPQESLSDDYFGRQPLRHTVTVGFKYLTNDLIDLNLTAQHMAQGNSTNTLIGAILGVRPTTDSNIKLNFGMWHKQNESSYFPFIGLDVSNYSVGANYTVYSNKISGLSPKTLELSLIITDKNYTKYKRDACKF